MSTSADPRLHLDDDYAQAQRAVILKAGRRWQTEGPNRNASIRLYAVAEVASDVLGVGMTPWAFEQAIKDISVRHPHPNVSTMAPIEAARARQAWERLFVAHVLDHIEGR